MRTLQIAITAQLLVACIGADPSTAPPRPQRQSRVWECACSDDADAGDDAVCSARAVFRRGGCECVVTGERCERGGE